MHCILYLLQIEVMSSHWLPETASHCNGKVVMPTASLSLGMHKPVDFDRNDKFVVPTTLLVLYTLKAVSLTASYISSDDKTAWLSWKPSTTFMKAGHVTLVVITRTIILVPYI